MKYLGVPIDEKRLRNGDWDPVGEKMEKKLNCFLGKNLTIGGKPLIINSSLTSIILYMISFYRIPVGVKKRAEKTESVF